MFKIAVSGAKRTERWVRQEQNQGPGWAIYFGYIFLSLKLCSWQAQSRKIAMAFLCNNQIIAAKGEFISELLFKARWPDANSSLRACHGRRCRGRDLRSRAESPSHPYRMSHLIENNQSGRNNFLSFIRKFLLRYLAPFQFLACQAILLTIYLPLTLFWEHLLNILNWANYHLWLGKCFGAELPTTAPHSKAHIGGNTLKLSYHAVGIHSRKQQLEKRSRAGWATSCSVDGLGFTKH